MIKLQQYYIYKFASDRLKNDKYDIAITINQARKNGELVSIGDSQMLRTLRKMKGDENNIETLEKLLIEKKNLKKRLIKEENKYALYNVEEQIDKILFVPEIVSIVIKNIKHYEHIIKNGVFINNKRYVRLMCSAGQARRNNVLFVDADYELQLKKILNNDRKDVEIAPAKFNAYFALSSSSALPVTTPYFCVVPDCEISRKENVEFISEIEGEDDSIEICEKDVNINLFDGQGLISPRMAEQWAFDLGLDYIPSCFVIRSNFIKGMVAVIDFVDFSDNVAGKHIIKDIYGNDVNIRDMDVILTASQFKMYDAFDSTGDYQKKCEKNGLGWGVTRCAPKQENTYTFLNYQFVQALKLDKEQIASLCSKTIEYFNNISKNKLDYTLLYLLGSLLDKEYDENILEKINDNVTKAIILNNKLISDSYVQDHIQKTLLKKINEAYMGNLLVDGQYSFMCADPYAFMEYLFGMEIKGLLERNEYYSKYWIDKRVNKIAGMRSPLTWRSEINVLNLKRNEDIDYWFKYLNTCCVINVNGMDMALFGGSDFDGDIICLTNQKEVVDGAYGGLPILYETKKVPKTNIVEEELYQADIKGFNSKVGFLTNLSTTMYSMLPLWDEESPQHKELIRRLKQCRKEQGAIIDATKGLIIKPIPSHWTNYTKIKDEMSETQKQKAIFDNSILVEKRPQFMQHLYPAYNKEYKLHQKNYNLFSIISFGKELSEMIEKGKNELNDVEQEFIGKFYKYNPLLDSDCETNNVYKYIQSMVKNIKMDITYKNLESNIRILKDKNFEIDKTKLDKLYAIYKKYKSGKRNLIIKDGNSEEKYKTIEQYNKVIRRECLTISNDICELASLGVVICYELYPNDNKAFVWNVLGDGLIENIYKNRQKKISLPFLDKNGSINYLGKKYSKIEINAEEEQGYDFL